jgi:hypothetical protein
MLGEEYEIYLKSSLLLLAEFVFAFLVLLSIVEWSRGNKKPSNMKDTDMSEGDNNEGEAEFVHIRKSGGAEGGESPDNTGSNYNNKAPNSESQNLIDKYISKVDFNMKAEDLDKPWFHKQVTRAMAAELLKVINSLHSMKNMQ